MAGAVSASARHTQVTLMNALTDATVTLPTDSNPQHRDDHIGHSALIAMSGLEPDDARRPLLRQQAILEYTPLAARLAGRFRNRGEDLDDLIQVATMGLIKAVDRFDPQRVPAFEHYAIPTIVGELKRHFRDRSWALHV